jgi:hypothetical protein
MNKWLASLFGKKESAAPAEEDAAAYPIFPDQLDRKQRSEHLLTEAGIPINAHLPMIESEQETEIRSLEDIAQRLLALMAAAVKAEGVSKQDVDSFIKDRGVAPFLSADEAAFIADDDPDERSRIQFSWQYECASTLLWALKLTDAPLGLPDQICDVTYLAETVRDTDDLTVNGVRTVGEVLDEADLIYRCHWAVRQASLDGSATPGGLEPGVTMERHKALNWLIRYNEADWDDVTTDT